MGIIDQKHTLPKGLSVEPSKQAFVVWFLAVAVKCS